MAETPRRGSRYVGSAKPGDRTTPPRGARSVQLEKEPKRQKVDWREYCPLIEKEASRASNLTLRLKRKLLGRNYYQLVDRNGTLHMEIRRDSVSVHSDIGKVIAINAGIGAAYKQEMFKRAVRSSGDLAQLFEKHVLVEDPKTGKFFVHAADWHKVIGVHQQLEAPFRSLVRLQPGITNSHPENKPIRDLIFSYYPSPVETRLSVATVARRDGLHVSLHEAPEHRGVTETAMQPKQEYGITLWSMNHALKKRLIDALLRRGVTKLYFMPTRLMGEPRVVSLGEALAQAHFEPDDADEDAQ